MKRIVSIFLAVLMMLSVLTVVSSARGYTLSIPKTVSAHNLEAFGLHTMNVYSTEVPTKIDGQISKGEYPGPLEGCSLSAVPGDGLWMGAYAKRTDGTQGSYNPEDNWTDYIPDEDKPKYINNYLTYDDEYFYFGVETEIPAVRFTHDTDTLLAADGKSTLRNTYWFVDTRLNFMQSDSLALSGGGNNSSFAQTRYTLTKYADHTVANSVSINKRIFTVLNSAGKTVTTNVGTYVDELGQSWSSVVYKRPENFTYKVTILANGNWKCVFEGRQPLADVLRITDVEYEDGTPIDYVPEWGAWAFDMRLQTQKGVSATLPDGTKLELNPDDVIYAQTFLPCGGAGRSGKFAKYGEHLLTNTISAAIQTTTGIKSVTFLMNPVHFLGAYDESFDYNASYSQKNETILTTTSRVTRNRNAVLTSGVRGLNNRVVAAATKASSATGDNLTLTVVLSAAMILCAAGAVTVLVMKKRSSKVR